MKSKNEKRKIFGRITSTKVAALLSAAVLALPLSACGKSKKEEVPRMFPSTVEITTDTSNIVMKTFIDEYVSEYNSGTVTGKTEEYDYYTELFEILSNDPEPETIDKGLFEEPEVILKTYDFNKDEIVYDTKSDRYYYISDVEIKAVYGRNVSMVTKDGRIFLEGEEDSWIIKNINYENSLHTNLTYNKDGSFSICEYVEGKGVKNTYFFGEDGLLDYSEEEYSDTLLTTTYEEGNINWYETRDQDSELRKKVNKDGSSIVCDWGYLDETYEYAEYYSGEYPFLDEIMYFYDTTGALVRITGADEKVEEDNSKYVVHCVFYPNGDFYKTEEDINSNGQTDKIVRTAEKYGEEKIEIKYEKNEEGKFDKYINKWDENGRQNFSSKNDDVYIVEKDGIIYWYNADGTFNQAVKYEDNGTMFYNEDGTKKWFDGNDDKTIEYGEGEKIVSISDDDKRITYYDYENNIIQKISNLSEKEITVEGNGQTYNVPKNAEIGFRENQTISWISNTIDDEDISFEINGKNYIIPKCCHFNIMENGEIASVSRVNDEYYDFDKHVWYDKDVDVEIEIKGKIYKLSAGGHIYFHENANLREYSYDGKNRTTYYETGEKSSETNDDITIGYYKNENIQEIINNNKDGEEISVNDLFGKIYTIKNGERIGLTENGEVSSLRQDGELFNYSYNYYNEYDHTYYYVRKYNRNEPSSEYYFYHNDQLLGVSDGTFEIHTYGEGRYTIVRNRGATTYYGGDYWEQKCEVILPDRIIKDNGEVVEIKEEQTTEAATTETSTETVIEESEIDDDGR